MGKPREITEEERFYLDWARETVKNNIASANAALSQLLTISTAMLGSGVYFLSENVLPKWMLAATLASLFASLVAAIVAAMPRKAEVDINSPAAIKKHKQDVLARKRTQIAFCVWPLLLALGIAALGVIAKAFGF